MKEINEVEMESMLAGQIPEYQEPTQVEETVTPTETPVETAAEAMPSRIGQKLNHKFGGHGDIDMDEIAETRKAKHLSGIGENIYENADFRDSWIDVDKRLLGDRAQFYPEDWQFRIKPASVEAIRNWSVIDDENPNSVDDVFNEILKSCLAIRTGAGRPLPWGNIRSWDRFFFILLIREYTMKDGEVKIAFNEDCSNCDNPVEFTLNSQSLMYDMPDPEVMHYFAQEDQTWVIDPAEYDIEGDPITLYLPTLEKDANIKAWLIQRVQDKKKIDTVFIKFLPWMAKSISKDLTVATRQIREYEYQYKDWDADMFSFMNDVIKNITITPSQKLIETCPTCGEEVTADIRFPNGVSALFNVQNKHKKFGKK